MAFDPISAALDIGGKIIDRVWPDPTQAAQAKMQLFQLQQTGELAQITATTDLAKAQDAVNAAEAASGSVFVAGWRPAVGWCCAVGVGVQFLGPLLSWGSSLAGHPVQFPTMDTGTLMPLLLGMLGLGGMHTYENISGVKNSGLATSTK